MEKLQLEYKKYGNNHKQIYRQGDIAIYEMTSPETGRVLGYEVFEVIKKKERVIAGKQIAASEATPPSEDWGYKGYTVWLQSSAMLKADILQAAIDNRNLSKGGSVNTKIQ